MKLLLFTAILCYAALATANEISDNCIEESDACGHESEYNAYLDCVQTNRRQKRSIGCPLAEQEGCEYVDCTVCGSSCGTGCTQCGMCTSSCRQCCSNTCSSNLCCHKTCHNQCKTNYCRAECKRECKERINVDDTSDAEYHMSDIKTNNTNDIRHNITTIINLHNIINNTNLIDIPIKINNTNYNNITLRRDGDGFIEVSGSGSLIRESGMVSRPDPGTQNNCCFVIGEKQCVKLPYYPFGKCYHVRERKCGTFCTSPVVHSRNELICNGNGGDCRSKLVYIPASQPPCIPQTTWPYVNCNNRHARHASAGLSIPTPSHDSSGIGPIQGLPSYPGIYQGGYPGGYQGYPGYPAYPSYLPYPYPSYPAFPAYAPQPFYGYGAVNPMIGGYGQYHGAYHGAHIGAYGGAYPGVASFGYPGFSGGYPGGYPAPYVGGHNIQSQPGYESSLQDSPDTYSDLGYPQTSYIHEVVIPTNASRAMDQQTVNSPPKSTVSRYAVIAIEPPKSENDVIVQKEKRHRRKHDILNEKKEKSENKFTTKYAATDTTAEDQTSSLSATTLAMATTKK